MIPLPEGRNTESHDEASVAQGEASIGNPVTLTKSSGVTPTERMLADFCERSFLKLWSYPNPYKNDGNELCDLLAVFGNHIFIFFDREVELTESNDKDPKVLWNRWRRKAVDKQVKTAHGAERYIRSSNEIFLDAKRTRPFPISIDVQGATIHKILVAHGAKEACENASVRNVYGSLAISYSDRAAEPDELFHVQIDRHKPVHILDSHNMPIILTELDTVADFAAYLDEKAAAIAKFDYLSYCGEEDLLAHYLLNFDNTTKRHVIGPKGEHNINAVMIGEGEWRDFSNSDVYKATKSADRTSYFWDELIQRTCQNSIDGTLTGNSNIFRGESAICEMAREPRFMRRGLVEKMLRTVEAFPDLPGQFTRQVTFLPSFYPNVGYVFLQFRAPEEFRAAADYREKRQLLLEIACGAAKNKFENLQKIIGIGIDAPKFSGGQNAEDFILLPCENWSSEMRSHYELQNEPWQFFGTPKLRKYQDNLTQFVQPPRSRPGGTRAKIGRNDPCPCGSGRKFKKCHGP
jgi:hypothetical protein